MGTWATASLFIAGLLWLEVKTNPQLFQTHQKPSGNYQLQPRQQQLELLYLSKERPEGVAQSHSALDLQPQHRLKLAQINNFPARNAQYDQNDPIDKADSLYNNFKKHFEKNLEQTQPQTFSIQGANERNGYEIQALAKGSGYDDYKTSQTTHILGPHQIETIKSEHFHNQVPAFDISEYQHHASEKHGEVHYHQHKHIHKHEHKQEHVHQHKQDHQHKHIHSQQHKHDHHAKHKHEHDHHQQHKHGHKHENHHDHKHHHGHKHQHHSENKHKYHHGYKHGHGHGHGHKYHHHKHY